MKIYKIMFLCGTLEPGKDGVGDYSRIFASELINLGHEVSLLAIKDRFITSPISEIQYENETAITTLRLPIGMEKNLLIEFSKQFIKRQNVDWLSLQFVIYSFHKKGIPLNLSNLLSKIGEGKKWHIMFHELWIGMMKEDTNRHKLIGLIQKKIIIDLVRKINPSLIHTQTNLYLDKLNSIAIKSKYLTLFSNIPFISQNSNNLKPKKENFKHKFLVFGSIQSETPVDDFLKEVLFYSSSTGIDIELTFIGRNGNNLEKWLSICDSIGLKTKVLGEQPKEMISKVLEKTTVGISTTPYIKSEKSGTVAAMKVHKLPIICVSKIVTPRGYLKEIINEGIFQYSKGNLNSFLHQLDIPVTRGFSSNEVALSFLNQLKEI